MASRTIETVTRARVIAVLVVCLSLLGLLMIGSASTVDALRDFGDKWYYLRLQSIWWLVGITSFFIVSRIPYQRLEKYALPFLIINAIFLLIVILPIGPKVLGARRWISIGQFTFQPAELAKLSFCLYFASLFKKGRLVFSSFAVVVGATVLLVMLEPDLGTTLVLVGISLAIYFFRGQELLKLFALTPVMLAVLVGLILISPYRRDRLFTYLNHARDPQGSSYHIRQVLLSFGSGGWFGTGLGQSRQKYEFLPEVTTDSIFAVLSEELGFVGGAVLILAYLLLVLNGLSVARDAPTSFGQNMAVGITSWIGIQAFINLSSMVALFPLTGIPLPFLSYGGSALVIILLSSGILVNIAASHDQNSHFHRRSPQQRS